MTDTFENDGAPREGFAGGPKDETHGKHSTGEDSTTGGNGKTKGKRRGNGDGRNKDGYPHGEKEYGVEADRFIYYDENGKPHGMVKRMEPKQFPQFHFEWIDKIQADPRNWVKGAPERPILYWLCNLVKAAPGTLLAVTEGEKDADTAIDIGFPFATCNAGGAVNEGDVKWASAEFKAPLAGHDIILFEDNDDSGRKHVHVIARELKGIARSIKIVRFREFSKKGFDLTDFVEMRKGEDKSNAEIYAEVLARAVEHADFGGEPVSLDDFIAFLPAHDYIYIPTRAHWPASSVNSTIPPIVVGKDQKGKPIKIFAATWLDQNQHVEQMTWAPGEPMLIRNRLIMKNGWVDKKGAKCFNTYLPPTLESGDPEQAQRWIELGKKLYPNEFEEIIQRFAFKVQNPGVKINHALLLGGNPGIGKDTWLEAVKQTVGSWNVEDISPTAVMGNFNGFGACVFLRISEARDLGDVSRYDFYERMKIVCASPPDVLRINEKHLREYYVPNVCGVVITTNHKTDSIYLPPEDRRNFVTWSEVKEEEFPEDFWIEFWDWYRNGGFEHVAAYLRTLDVSKFDPKAPPRLTPAFWDIVDASRAPEESELQDLIDAFGNPPALTREQLVTPNSKFPQSEHSAIVEWLEDRKNRRAIPHRLEKCGYTPIRNELAKDGLWKVGKARQVIYARDDLSKSEQLQSANDLVKQVSDRAEATAKWIKENFGKEDFEPEKR